MTDQKPLPDLAFVRQIIERALAEDIGAGDITSELTIPPDELAEMRFVAREPMVVCGAFIPAETYALLSADIQVEYSSDGRMAGVDEVLATAKGNARALLAGERVALNLMQRMCGVATLTAQYVEAVKGTKAIILDTRKTMPGLRVIDKYAVRTGGGQNHRFRLDDMVLIKDNHIAVGGRAGIEELVANVKQQLSSSIPVVVECDTLEQFQAALAAKSDRILLDNMSLAQLREAVHMAGGNMPLEASGGVSLATVKAIAETGVDFISVGKLTHSAVAMDIGADVVFV